MIPKALSHLLLRKSSKQKASEFVEPEFLKAGKSSVYSFQKAESVFRL